MMAQTPLQRLVDENRRNLTEKKFHHVLGVLHTAVVLAMRFGVDPNRAALAALIHDRSKAMAPERIEADLDRLGTGVPEEDRPFPAIWHGNHAAALARMEPDLGAGEETEEIARAVEVHSTADREMSPLAQLLFLADFIEPCRSFDGVDAAREAAIENLTEGFKKALAMKCRYLKRRGRAINPRARRALEFYAIH